jgi:hypothetical protein
MGMRPLGRGRLVGSGRLAASGERPVASAGPRVRRPSCPPARVSPSSSSGPGPMSLDVLPRGKSTLADYMADKLDVLFLEAEVALVELLDGLGELQVPEADVDGELAERIPGGAEVYPFLGEGGIRRRRPAVRSGSPDRCSQLAAAWMTLQWTAGLVPPKAPGILPSAVLSPL